MQITSFPSSSAELPFRPSFCFCSDLSEVWFAKFSDNFRGFFRSNS